MWDYIPTEVSPFLHRGCSPYDHSFRLTNSGQPQVGCNFKRMLPFHFCYSFMRYWNLIDIQASCTRAPALPGSSWYLLCLDTLQGTSGLHGLHLAILLQDTSSYWFLFTKMSCSGFWKTPGLIMLHHCWAQRNFSRIQDIRLFIVLHSQPYLRPFRSHS